MGLDDRLLLSPDECNNLATNFDTEFNAIKWIANSNI